MAVYLIHMYILYTWLYIELLITINVYQLCIICVYGVCMNACIGKYGNQGVDLADVTDITIGRATEILQTNGQEVSVDLYLSIISNGKSIDLCFQRYVCILCYYIYDISLNLCISVCMPLSAII